MRLNKLTSINVNHNSSSTSSLKFINEPILNSEKLIHRKHENRIKRKLDNISQLLGINSMEKISFKNRPVVNLNKPELAYNYNSYFVISPNKNRRRASISLSKVFKNVNINYNFTDRIGDQYKLKKYSQNNVLLASKTLKPNDSFEEFEKGNFL